MACGFLEVLLVDCQHVILQCHNLPNLNVSKCSDSEQLSYNLLIITELEIILDYHIFIFLDLVSIEETFLHFLEVPCNDELSSRRNNGVFFLAFALVDPGYWLTSLPRRTRIQ